MQSISDRSPSSHLLTSVEDAKERAENLLRQFLDLPNDCALNVLAVETKSWVDNELGWIKRPCRHTHGVTVRRHIPQKGYEVLCEAPDSSLYSVAVTEKTHRVCSEVILNLAAQKLAPFLKKNEQEVRAMITSADAFSIEQRNGFEINLTDSLQQKHFTIILDPQGRHFNLRTRDYPTPVHSPKEAVKRALQKADTGVEWQVDEVGEFIYSARERDLAIPLDTLPLASLDEDPSFVDAIVHTFKNLLRENAPGERPGSGKAWLVKLDHGDENLTYFVDKQGLCVLQNQSLFQRLKEHCLEDEGEESGPWRVTDWYDYLIPSWETVIVTTMGLCEPIPAAICTLDNGERQRRYLINCETGDFTRTEL